MSGVACRVLEHLKETGFFSSKRITMWTRSGNTWGDVKRHLKRLFPRKIWGTEKVQKKYKPVVHSKCEQKYEKSICAELVQFQSTQKVHKKYDCGGGSLQNHAFSILFVYFEIGPFQHINVFRTFFALWMYTWFVLFLYFFRTSYLSWKQPF